MERQYADSTDGFAEHRAGWLMPIHDLLVKHHASAVFHGHDHLYVRSERDRVTYQCVPQPGNLNGNMRTAERYGYKCGTVLGSPGHMRVHVHSEECTMELVRSATYEENAVGAKGSEQRRSNSNEPNGSVIEKYTIEAAKARD